MRRCTWLQKRAVATFGKPFLNGVDGCLCADGVLVAARRAADADRTDQRAGSADRLGAVEHQDAVDMVHLGADVGAVAPELTGRDAGEDYGVGLLLGDLDREAAGEDVAQHRLGAAAAVDDHGRDLVTVFTASEHRTACDLPGELGAHAFDVDQVARGGGRDAGAECDREEEACKQLRHRRDPLCRNWKSRKGRAFIDQAAGGHDRRGRTHAHDLRSRARIFKARLGWCLRL
jgi:hypothetical protein